MELSSSSSVASSSRYALKFHVIKMICRKSNEPSAPLAHPENALLEHSKDDSTKKCSPEQCLTAIFSDICGRFTILGGREGMPYSLGSVYAGMVVHYLHMSLKLVDSIKLKLPSEVHPKFTHIIGFSNDDLIISHNLKLTSYNLKTMTIKNINDTRKFPSVLPSYIYIAPDGYIFVLEPRAREIYRAPTSPFIRLSSSYTSKIKIYTPDFIFDSDIEITDHYTIGNICANDKYIYVSLPDECAFKRISTIIVFDRRNNEIIAKHKNSNTFPHIFYDRFCYNDGKITCYKNPCFVNDTQIIYNDYNPFMKIYDIISNSFVAEIRFEFSRFYSIAVLPAGDIVVSGVHAKKPLMCVFDKCGTLLSTISNNTSSGIIAAVKDRVYEYCYMSKTDKRIRVYIQQ
jgi:hypothetical protein